ncbi:MAG: hypothetical protein RSH79_04005, partial [Clostridiales bacterium]
MPYGINPNLITKNQLNFQSYHQLICIKYEYFCTDYKVVIFKLFVIYRYIKIFCVPFLLRTIFKINL